MKNSSSSSFQSDLPKTKAQIIQRLRTFVDEIAYPLMDCNYFRKLGPPVPMFNHVEPDRGSEIFVSGIPRDAIEDEIFTFFSQVGTIYDMRLMLSESFIYNRGYAFIRFFNPEQAKRAVAFLDKAMFRNLYEINVQKSVENNRLYMSGLPFSKSKIQIWDELIDRGVADVTDVIVYKSHVDKTKNRGFVFIEFKNHETAANVRHKYNRAENLYLFGKKISVDWSICTQEVDPEVMARVTRLFLRNLNVNMTRRQFVSSLSKIIDPNTISKVYKAKDYAFVHFIDRNSAEYALNNLLHYFKETDVEVTWSIPPEEVRKIGKTSYNQHKIIQSSQWHTVGGNSVNFATQHDSSSPNLNLSQSPAWSPADNSNKDGVFNYSSWWDLLEARSPTTSCPLSFDSDSSR